MYWRAALAPPVRSHSAYRSAYSNCPAMQSGRSKKIGTSSARNLALASLADGRFGLCASFGGAMAEAASVCLEDQKHSPGVRLAVDALPPAVFILDWIEATRQATRTWADLQEATEYGACAIALLLVEKLFGLEVTQRSYKGPGFDYWLGRPGDGEQFGRRLEVSGILNGNRTTINQRFKKKTLQTLRGGEAVAAYVAVVEFGAPRAKTGEAIL